MSPFLPHIETDTNVLQQENATVSHCKDIWMNERCYRTNKMGQKQIHEKFISHTIKFKVTLNINKPK